MRVNTGLPSGVFQMPIINNSFEKTVSSKDPLNIAFPS